MVCDSDIGQKLVRQFEMIPGDYRRLLETRLLLDGKEMGGEADYFMTVFMRGKISVLKVIYRICKNIAKNFS